jgi:hypothetical protein
MDIERSLMKPQLSMPVPGSSGWLLDPCLSPRAFNSAEYGLNWVGLQRRQNAKPY